jgi:hypothetical protein
MEDFSAFTSGERAPLEALGAAVLQGANTGTRDIDLWFESLSDPRIAEAVRDAGGIWISGSLGMRPPQIGGDAIGDRIDVVTHMHGLGNFADEYPNAVDVEVDGVRLHVLRLDRIIASKRATKRTKDLAVLPALEEALAAVEDAEKE